MKGKKRSIIFSYNAWCMVTSEKMKKFKKKKKENSKTPFPRAHRIFRQMFSFSYFSHPSIFFLFWQRVSICYQQEKNRWQHLALLNWKRTFSFSSRRDFLSMINIFMRILLQHIIGLGLCEADLNLEFFLRILLAKLFLYANN